MMSWQIFALISIILLSASNVLQRVLMKDDKSDAFTSSIVFQFLGALIVGGFAFWRGFVLPPISQLPWNFLYMAVLYGLGTLFMFKALQYIEASETTIVSSCRSVITVMSALFFLHETFNTSKLAGVLLILLAVFFVSKTKSGFKVNRGVVYALGMAICYGLAVTNDAFILKQTANVLSYTATAFLFPAIFLLLMHPRAIKNIRYFLHPAAARNMVVMTFFYSIAAVAFFSALEAGAHASQLGPINQSAVVVTVLLAAITLKERDRIWTKLLSAVLIMAGVVLLK